MTTTRWLFAEQLGPHFLDDPHQQVLLVESTAVLRRRPVHRAKAHLVLSALRHRAAELGDRCTLVRAETYAEVVRSVDGPLSVCDPTSYAARRFVQRLASDGVDLEVLPARGFAASEDDFRTWADGRGSKRLLMEDFYRGQRRRLGLLLDADGDPVGGRWNFDDENREPPPKDAVRLDVDEPWWPTEDDVDAQVREDLDRMARDDGVEFVGDDGPRRFAVTRRESLAALRHFLSHRLEDFGTYEDAMLDGDPWLAHSLLSVPMNLGLLDPVEVARKAESAAAQGVRLASVEGFVRQVVGWRDYVWHLYWYLGEDYAQRNELSARRSLPAWFDSLDASEEVEAACLSSVLGSVRRDGWTHHIPRLMVLGNWALQQGYSPTAVTEWFRSRFVDGYDWVMTANVVGMSLHADGGVMATKPYVAGGAYVNRMSGFCGGCRYDPKKRTGPDACPFTSGYWAFLDRNADALQGNSRMSQSLAGLRRRDDIAEIRATAVTGQSPP